MTATVLTSQPSTHCPRARGSPGARRALQDSPRAAAQPWSERPQHACLAAAAVATSAGRCCSCAFPRGQVCGNSSGIGLHNWENRSSLILGPADGEPESLGPWGTCRSPEPPTGLLSVVPLRWLPLPAAREAKAPWGAMKRKAGSTDSLVCPTCPVRAALTGPGGRGSLVLPRQ